MKTKSIFGIVLTGVMCLCLIGCQNDDFMEKTNPLRTAQKGVVTGDTWSLNLEATISDVADTRVVKLEKDDSNNDVLNGYWKEGETIGVYDGVNKLGVMKVTNVSTDGKNAKIEGSDLALPNATNMKLTLIYPNNADNEGNNAWYYTGQKGTVTDISTYDYMTSELEVQREGGSVTYTETSLTFTSQQSIYRFGFKNGENAISVKQFTVNSENIVQQFNGKGTWEATYGPLTITPANPTTDLLYVAINNKLAGTFTGEQITANAVQDTYQFSAVASDDALYMGTKEIKATFFENQSQFNSFKNVAMTQAKLATSTSTTNAAW